MWRPRKPVPPNTVTVRSLVGTMVQMRQYDGPRAVGLLILCWRLWKHGRHTFQIDVERQEYQRLAARVSPLVDKGVRFIDQGARPPGFSLTVDRIRSSARNDEIKSCARPMVWRVGRHLCRKCDAGEIEIIAA